MANGFASRYSSTKAYATEAIAHIRILRSQRFVSVAEDEARKLCSYRAEHMCIGGEGKKIAKHRRSRPMCAITLSLIIVHADIFYFLAIHAAMKPPYIASDKRALTHILVMPSLSVFHGSRAYVSSSFLRTQGWNKKSRSGVMT